MVLNTFTVQPQAILSVLFIILWFVAVFHIHNHYHQFLKYFNTDLCYH